MTEKHRANFPSRQQQVKNFVESMRQSLKDPGFATNESYDRRRGICDACPYMRNNRCTKCGCLLMAKLKLKSARCPIGKW